MQKTVVPIVLLLAGIVGLLPLINFIAGDPLPWLTGAPVAALNFLGWSLVLTFLFWRLDFKKSVLRLADQVGVDIDDASLEKVFSVVLSEVNRKNHSLSLNLVERKISSDEELSRALERIVALSLRLMDGESAELALFDRESGMYHSSFVLGKPFRASAQAMLSGALEREEAEPSPDVLIQPIAFAGSVLGSLRVALKNNRLPTTGDRQIMSLLALQGGLAIINCQYTGQLIRMKQASEESIKAKTGFLANLSHELRGPLGIIINAVELVLDGLCGQVSDDQKETLQMVRSNGEHLLELINDVLDYAKMESGKVRINPVDVLLNDILKDLIGVVRKQAETKSHKLLMLPSDEAFAISCDRRHLRQMLINLLTNAIKYTPDGGTIELWAERIPGNKIKINVRDTGVGIDPAERRKVFSAFERVENSYSITQVGTGLGMPLTKKLAEANNGQVGFDSEPSQGSHFWLVFPAVEAQAALVHEKDEEIPEVKGSGEMVLLVEKDEGERKMIARYLSHLGFGVAVATTQTEALEVLQNKEVRIVILDNNVVDSPGADIVNTLRNVMSGNRIPIILVSSRAFVFDIENYLRAGVDRCLIKPIVLKKLGVIVRELIDGSYSGAVIDEGELESASDEREKRLDLPGGKLIGVDDILH